jgi:two-component system sensor histidine kinase BaeS
MRIGKLGIRLIAIFISLVVVTLLVDVIVGTATVTGDIGQFATAQEMYVVDAAALSAGAAFEHGRWDQRDLKSVIDAAALAGGGVTVLDAHGRQIAEAPGYAGFSRTPQLSRPILASGSRVGQVRVRFGSGGVRAAVARLSDQRWRARVYAFLIAVALALVASILLAGRITGPLDRLLVALRSREAGDRRARVRDVRGVGELRELLLAFNATTDALDGRERAQRELVGNVAHELRTPVAILQAGTESMLDGITEPSRANLSSLHDEVLRLSVRLDDLLALARASSASIQLTVGRHDLAGLARAAAGRLSDPYAASGVALELRLEPADIRCDDQRTIEIITNLMTNALKYSRDGGTVTVETRLAGPDDACFQITDTGIGIPPDELPRVTERFFRGAGSYAVASGSGIGLSVVTELVRAQHGTFTITSEPGTGTQVTVTLPRAPHPREHKPREHGRRG